MKLRCLHLPHGMLVTVQTPSEGVTFVIPPDWTVWKIQHHLGELRAFYS